LRASEKGLLNLDAPIAGLIRTETNALLQSDGYDTTDITVRLLLMHASGMADHVGDGYIEQVFTNPTKVWTPSEQIEVLVTTTDPMHDPGEQFEYSDTGYVLLGEILSEITNRPLNQSVRELLKLDDLKLPSLYWDEREQPNNGVPERAHQWIDGFDIYPLHGSMDGHGGGGLVANTEDVAAFYHALFNGKVFSNPATLELMTTAPGHPKSSPYRFGVFKFEIEERDAYGHGGFWGTQVTHVPSLNLTIAGVALDEGGYRSLRQHMIDIIEQQGNS